MMKRVHRTLAVLLIPSVVAGCSWLEDRSPDTLRVLIDGDTGSLNLITSTQFAPTTNEIGDLGVEVFVSDTSVASFPYDRSWDIQNEQRFLLLGFVPDSTAITVRVRVLIDGDTEYDRTVTVLVNQPVRYIYLFNQQVIQDFELL